MTNAGAPATDCLWVEKPTARRALLIGSQTEGLVGVHADVEVMDAVLTARGFTTTCLTGAGASTAGILAAYEQLIADTGEGDAALIHYSGHGSRVRDPAPGRAAGSAGWWQVIVPSDVAESTPGDVRLILAEELQLLQLRLTARTENVTVVLDCCHSARMSRDASALPRALELAPDLPTLRARRAAALADPLAGTATGDANPHAVRIVGCGPEQSAFEMPAPQFGGRSHGLLTAALATVLAGPAADTCTWSDVMDVVRRQVLDVQPAQRPAIEGSDDRLLFSVETRSRTGVRPVRIIGGRAVLEDAALFGVAVGDSYELVEPGASAPVDTARVSDVVGGLAVLRTLAVPVAGLPPNCAARPLRVSLGARRVVVEPADAPGRAEVVAAIDRSPYARVADPAADATATTPPVATVRLGGDRIELFDAGGLPLYDSPRPQTDAGTVADDVTALAAATHLRELASGTGAAALPDDVTIEVLRIAGAGEVVVRPGDHLFEHDRLLFRLSNGAAAARHVAVLDIGVAGAVSMLTVAETDGLTLAADETHVLGADNLFAERGLELFWPSGVPRAEPRQETFLVVVSDRPVTGLARLEQEGVVRRSARGTAPITRDRPATELERLVDAVVDGRRDARPPAAPSPLKYRVVGIDVVFHATTRPTGDGEPPFTVDERPDESFRFVIPRGTDVPRRVAVRLKELTVHDNRSWLRARVRVDALVITAVPDGAGLPYAAGTARFDRIRGGDRLPFDDLLVYEGPVGRFVDIAVWVSRDDRRDLDLSELLAKELGDAEVAGALTALAGLAVAAPVAAVAVGAVAATAVLVRTATRLVEVARGTCIGAYRTSLLPHQRFGAVPPGRHPAQGVIDAQDISFAFEVIELDPG